ncbi:mobilisation protein (MobC) [Butyrivibrio sp. ob235]|uniref:plasmid mobilization protein n=1 Tax=Butyrivibrio sp. ob235 TaxID=1761780 RepID=UPI0008B39C2F|nr:plasmid mobilization relaxosome protein MobC [Butyrivibrio sp. ob235]SEM20046.1 mobilisation protein (MobC) [Butyrivibrio sp. ob235]
MKKTDTQILIKISKSDKEKIRERMESIGVRNLSAFMRKMAIDGYIINLDLTDVKEVVRLLKINSNNLNQYAKKANQTGNIYLENIKELQRQQDEIWEAVKAILVRLSNIY